ncbi:2-aminoadipate transaminase [Vibrio aerogenes CECT 7868]|uniref:2-aminoadipate transaminase n=1 Tax=Vibrio aerogenes CECT 7868 TaxID=1216006 RepID=A0A1M6EDG7_9VIBR|nr:PLP-dependent aminotransferase family protein [Vibrio aerogenes]SHI83368.1 2-aminoadipate transaminase [Vibrio aerogenes CECT 7868]
MKTATSLQQMQSSYIREILSAASDSNVISLAGGLPDQATFPIDLMQPTLIKLAEMPEVFQYEQTAGYAPLLTFLSGYFSLPENHDALVCTGSQQGLDLLARAYINPGDSIVMESPGYLGAMQVFGLVQANILTVSQTKNGPDLEALEHHFATQSPKLFYAVPDFHNPTGVCWSLETRKKVAALCLQYQVTLVEDAPYRELRFSGDTQPYVSQFCPDCSIVLRSFSKIASPGMRLGVVTGQSQFIQPMIKVKQGADLHTSVPMQVLLLGLLQHEGFAKHLARMRQLYQSRYEVLYTQLREQLPAGCTVSPVNGGMFVWVTLPACDPFALAAQMLAHGVAVVPSPVFYPANSDQIQPGLRLNFTNSTEEALIRAVSCLSQTLKAFLTV